MFQQAKAGGPRIHRSGENPKFFQIDFQKQPGIGAIIHHQGAQVVDGAGQISFVRFVRRVIIETSRKDKGAPFAMAALDAKGALHHLHQSLADGQPQPGAAILAGGGAVGLGKGLEQAINLFRGHADTAVLDRNFQCSLVVFHGQRLGADQNLPSVGKLDGVVGQIGQHLSQAQRIPDQGVGDGIIDMKQQLQPLFPRSHRQHRAQLLHDLIQVEGNFLDIQLARLNFGRVENIVDDAEQGFRRAVGLVQIVTLLGAHFGLQAEPDQTEHAIHGRANFVAHVGQKFILGLGGALKIQVGLFQLGGAIRHPLCQLLTLLAQGFVGLFQGQG